MRASSDPSVLIEQVVYLASKGREATSQDPIFDMPKGTSAGKSCPIARALNLDCSVGSSQITFTSEAHARAVAEACGLTYKAGNQCFVPSGHPFRSFVSSFDSGRTKQMQALKLGAGWK